MDAILSIALWLQDADKDKPKPPYEAVVTVLEARVRETRKALSKVVATVKEKDRVTVLELSEGKARIRVGDVEGWAYEDIVMETKKYQAKEQAAGSDPARGAESHAYAKGFDPETESRMKNERNLAAQYAMVDRLEKTPAYRRSVRELEARLAEFRRGGGLGEYRR